MSDPIIIMSAPNGARRQKKDHPKIPITPNEMAECAEQILSAGASILHLHVRDSQNRHSLDIAHYEASIDAIHNKVGDRLIIQSTTEAVGMYSRHEQIKMVKDLKPEAVSLALRELCPSNDELKDFETFIKWIKSEHIFPQYILYNEEDYDRFESYRKKGILQTDRPFALFVFGSYQEPNSHPNEGTKQLQKTSLNANFPWAACGFNINEKQCVLHAAQNGGHIRVGFENNLWQDENIMLHNNSDMIRFSANIATQENRPIINAHDVRNMFNLRE